MKKIKIILLACLAVVSLFLVSCSNAESRIKSEINKANYCITKEDCVNIGSKCPFDCYIYVNQREAERIKAMVDSYESKCVYDCIYCYDVACLDGKCKPICE